MSLVSQNALQTLCAHFCRRRRMRSPCALNAPNYAIRVVLGVPRAASLP